MTSVHQKRKTASLSSPLLHHHLSIALGLLDDDLLLLRKEHLYILSAGAWWDREFSVNDCLKDKPAPAHFHNTGRDLEQI